MQLPFRVGDRLATLGDSITSQSLRSHLLALLVGLALFAVVWPALIDLFFMLWYSLVGLFFALLRWFDRAMDRVARLGRRRENAQREPFESLQAPADQHAPGCHPRGDPGQVVEKQGLPPPQPAGSGGGVRGDSAAEVSPPSSYPEIAPLTTLEQLLGYERPTWGQGFAPVRPRPFVARPFPPLKSRMLVCHDLAGGYGEDRWVQGGGYDRAYRVYDWGLIDIFVYFSHNLVTIPTAGWTDVAHRHGTRVLGTFITEWDEGYDVCAELLSSPEKARNAATKLTHIALDHGLDGWLVNIENKVDPGSNIETLVIFLKSLTAQMRAAKSVSPSTTDAAAAAATSVLWYDSVTSSGDLAWQDRLNGKNRLFFDACDGIFTNYCWKGDYPSASALEAKARRFDVYTGIDVFGRGTWGGGGFDANKALGKIRRAGVSAALFAPAWTMENKTSGGGRVDPGKGEDWREVEHEFRSVDAEFWDKVGAAWDRPRPVPRAPEDGRGGCVPLVVNFGRGVGNAWRIRGEEVAVFGAASPAGGGDAGTHGQGARRMRGLAGGAFFDLASQCITPLVGLRGGNGQGSELVNARRFGDLMSPSAIGADGSIRASYTYGESFDGGSALCFAGILKEATATFPLFSCDIPIPAESLEVRVTFSGNADSEIVLVLVLDELGERQQVVLRDWGAEGPPSTQPVYSKQLTRSLTRTAYAPAAEEWCGETSAGTLDDEGLHARVRALRDAGESYDDIWKRLRAERAARHAASGSTSALRGAGGGGASAAALLPGSSPNKSFPWVTRKYVVRDLRVGGSRAIREIRVVCAPRRKVPDDADADADADVDMPRSPSAAAAAAALRRDREQRGGSAEQKDRTRRAAGLVAYRACLGEIVVGSWRRDTPSTFGTIERLRAVEVEVARLKEGDGEGWVVVDLSLQWRVGALAAGERGPAGVVHGTGRSLRPLHCDLWRASEEEAGGWVWLGRAYGDKYRVQKLEVGHRGETVLAVQQVNDMGYRQPAEDWARLRLCPP